MTESDSGTSVQPNEGETKMVTKTYTKAAVLGLVLSLGAVGASAQETAPTFEFSAGLQDAFGDLNASNQALKAEVEAALAGATIEEAEAIVASYADEVQALRDAEAELRELGAAEMQEAGVSVLERGPRQAPDEADVDDETAEAARDAGPEPHDGRPGGDRGNRG
jgi:hypothetical protein